jgi:type 1 glutamine amidotransferase
MKLSMMWSLFLVIFGGILIGGCEKSVPPTSDLPYPKEVAASLQGPVHVLLLTGGHGFEEAEFFALFDTMKSIHYTHIRISEDSSIFESIENWPYDAIVMYNMTQNISPLQRENFMRLLDRGVGLVALHHSLCNFQAWPEYRRIIGAHYYEKPMEIDGVVYPAGQYKHDVRMQIRAADITHPITAGIETFEIFDETYNHYAIEPDNHLLLVTDEPTSRKEIGWVRRYKNANVCYIQLGHGPEAYANPTVRTILERAIAWSARHN